MESAFTVTQIAAPSHSSTDPAPPASTAGTITGSNGT